MRTLVWFRGKDLRVHDHAPLREAAEQGEVVPLFVLDPYFFAPRRRAELPNRMAYLVAALAELRESIARLGSTLLLVEGKSVDLLPKLVHQWKIDRVVAHRWCEPFARERDRRIAAALDKPFDLFEGETLLPPGALKLYSVYTPFSKALLRELHVSKPLPPPRLKPNPVRHALADLPEVGQSPLPAGEAAARKRLERFDAGSYEEIRNRLDLAATSRFSADLHFGTLSIREVWAKTHAHFAFANELIWRDYCHAVLWHRPDALDGPLRPAFAKVHGRDPDERGWYAWVEGKTGYPVVDAACRQLLGEGFVHNRARMISAGFLTRHLLIDYRRGEAHYLKHLVDGDWANNNRLAVELRQRARRAAVLPGLLSRAAGRALRPPGRVHRSLGARAARGAAALQARPVDGAQGMVPPSTPSRSSSTPLPATASSRWPRRPCRAREAEERPSAHTLGVSRAPFDEDPEPGRPDSANLNLPLTPTPIEPLSVPLNPWHDPAGPGAPQRSAPVSSVRRSLRIRVQFSAAASLSGPAASRSATLPHAPR
ncbi:MAG: deoxyribodipyrimidine photo-lyase [Archangiaceae bacterium]|nr:deoxyribodipyrimidine photo-lyase [Archangiaceae bacterium]